MSVAYHEERGLLSGKRVTERPAKTQTISHEVLLSASPREVFDFCRTTDGYRSIMPTKITVIGQSDETITLGTSVVWNFYLMNIIPVRWVAHIEEFEEAEETRRFVDIQLRGLFTYFRHTHTCEPHGEGTRYRDDVVFASRMGAFLDRTAVRAEMNRIFRYRHRKMRELLGDGSA